LLDHSILPFGRLTAVLWNVVSIDRRCSGSGHTPVRARDRGLSTALDLGHATIERRDQFVQGANRVANHFSTWQELWDMSVPVDARALKSMGPGSTANPIRMMQLLAELRLSGTLTTPK
jgi:hypothetical protein